MNFDLSEDDTLLRDSVARWVQQNCAFEQRRKLAAGEPGFSREHWRNMARMGWLSLPFDASLGGLGGGALATMLLMEELGKGLVLEPYLPTVLLFGGLVSRSAAHRDEWVPRLIDGSVLGALACSERHSHYELADVQTTLRRAGDGWLLDGEKVRYRAACSADAGSAEAQRDLPALKVMVGRCGRLIGGEAIQMHGRMGMTDELAIGHGMKRLRVIDTSFGDADWQRQRFAALAND